MREIDLVVVKGKTVPIAVYEVLDYHTQDSFPHLMEVLSLFKDGLSKYREMNWDGAQAQFEKCLELNPKDAASQMYLERCELLRQSPPPLVDGQWDGVWIMDEK
jgi:adenylate cyclase